MIRIDGQKNNQWNQCKNSEQFMWQKKKFMFIRIVSLSKE